MDNPINALQESIYHAIYEGFSLIEYEDRDWEQYRADKTKDVRVKKTRRPEMRDIAVVGMFSQMWGSTALGFGGIGGQAMTNAYTAVLSCGTERAVYFGGRFAYKLAGRVGELFHSDIAKRHMLPVAQHMKYKASNPDEANA